VEAEAELQAGDDALFEEYASVAAAVTRVSLFSLVWGLVPLLTLLEVLVKVTAGLCPAEARLPTEPRVPLLCVSFFIQRSFPFLTWWLRPCVVAALLSASDALGRACAVRAEAAAGALAAGLGGRVAGRRRVPSASRCHR
jgi:hypothetical protein